MANSAEHARPLTIEEYLRFEEAAPTRHEYVAGVVYAMAGASRPHNRIIRNFVARLDSFASRGTCDLHFGNVKVRVRHDIIYYPDVVVTCDPADDDRLIVRCPCAVVEVTSPSTATTDRREKLANYREMPSLRAYLIVEQRRRRVEHHWRDDQGQWWRATVTGEDRIAIPCLDTDLSLDEIYKGVQFTALGEQEPEEYETDGVDGADGWNGA